jgi:alpha-mannosidase
VIDQWDVYPWMKLSQSLGINEWRYAIMPHRGNWQEGQVYRESEKFNLILESVQAGRGDGDLPKELSFIEVNSDDIVLSALKKHEHRNSVVLRLFNPTSDEISTNVNFYLPVKEAWLTNMNEERKEKLDLADENIINLTFGHKKILTCEVVF